MDVLTESTKVFENDLQRLSLEKREEIAQEVDNCVALFSTHKDWVYGKLIQLPLLQNLNGYDSSLYSFKVSEKLRVVLAIDEDPIFGQVIFTLFRAVQHDDLNKAFQSVAESLYQEILHQDSQLLAV